MVASAVRTHDVSVTASISAVPACSRVGFQVSSMSRKWVFWSSPVYMLTTFIRGSLLGIVRRGILAP